MSNKIDSASKKDKMHIDYKTSGLRCRNNKESYKVLYEYEDILMNIAEGKDDGMIERIVNNNNNY